MLFAQHYAKEPQEATEYFTNFVKNGTVIEQEEPVVFQQSMVILANKVHSEAPKATLSAQSYPRCEWCMATEGYREVSNFRDYEPSSDSNELRWRKLGVFLCKTGTISATRCDCV